MKNKINTNNLNEKNTTRDKQALNNAWEDFKLKTKKTQRSWANFLHYLKTNHNWNKNNYFGYKGTEIRVYGDKLELELDTKQEKIAKPKKIINTTKKNLNNNLTNKNKKIAMRTTWIAASILLTIWTVKYFQENNNNTRNTDKNNAEINKKYLSKTTKKTEENINDYDFTENIQLKNISQTLFTDSITQQDLINAVNKTINTETKKNIITFLNKWDILWLQNYLWFKESSEYKLNKSTWIIDKNTLKILNDWYFGIKWNEILTSNTIPQDVKDAYTIFMENKEKYVKNKQKLIVESKISMQSYLFDRDKWIVDIQPIIAGRHKGIDKEYVPFGHYYKNWKKKYYKWKTINRNTPEWRFSIEKITSINEKHYKIDWPKLAILLKLEELTTKSLKYDINNTVPWIHPPFMPKNDENKYINALKSKTIDDNYQSKWCINILNFGRILDNIDDKTAVNITQYNKYKQLMAQQENNKQKQKFSKKYIQKQTQEKLKKNIMLAQNIPTKRKTFN